MANNSADDEINRLGFVVHGRSWETRELNVNPMFSSQNEDYRAESVGRMVEEVSNKIDLTSGHMGQTTESLSKLSVERTGKENGDHNVPQNKPSKAEECDSEFPLATIVQDAEERECMSHKVAKIDEPDPGSLSEDASMQHDENRDLMHQQMAKPAESDCLFPELLQEENDKKGHCLSQQMLKTEILISESPLCTMEENNRKIGFPDPKVFAVSGFETESHSGTGVINDQLGDSRRTDNTRTNLEHQQVTRTENSHTKSPRGIVDENFQETDSNNHEEKQGKYFYYDSPLYEETGMWIPVSVPPMSESDHQEWTRGFCSNGGYLPEGDAGWGHCLGEEKELTMWDVVVEMVLAARGKVNALASGDIRNISWISGNLIEQAWKEMAQTLSESSLSSVQEILEAEPPKWLPDSTASTCMLCSVRFHPIMCTRHHCRFCGGIFCSECTRGRSLLPQKFLTAEPQRVCDVCCVRLESVQPYLMDQVSRAAQLPTHDLTDLSTLRSWLNFPLGQSMEYEIYKATNTIRGYSKVGSLKSEKRIPEAILRHAKGLAILTIVKVGVMVTYNIGTGLVIARREDGSWSPPSAISSFGVGWGAQAGGELTDLIIVLRTDDAIRTFSGTTHLSVGAGLSAAIGIIGRTAEADIRAGTSGYAACHTYSCSKGAFIGCSLEGSIVTTRTKENFRFYGSQSITANDILLGSLPRPPAASILYRALAELYEKL